MRYCLHHLDRSPTGNLTNNCCGWYNNNGEVNCWLVPQGENDTISLDRGLHRAIMVANDSKLYNLTLSGLVDLGLNEVSASTGTNDTWTTIDIGAYPDGVNKTQIHYETNLTDAYLAPREMGQIDVSMYVLASGYNDSAYLEIVLSGGTFATELSGATNATFNTTNIDSLGVGYSMLGIGGNNPDDSSDVMLLYTVEEVPPIDDTVYVDLTLYSPEQIMVTICGVWIFGIGFFCSV